MKKILAVLLASVMMLTLVACGNKDDVVVAEATGHTSHGFEVEVLYQEYGNGDVEVNIAYHSEDYGSRGLTYYGTVTKGTDEDGDPLVTLEITDFSCPSLEGVDLSYAYENPTTNTYNEKTGDYTLVFPLSIFGFADKEVTLEVTATDDPTDVTTWYDGYGISMEPVESATEEATE